MRTKPIIGNKVWFKPRGRGGWGWQAASWQGWVVIAVATAGILMGALAFNGFAVALVAAAIAAVLIGVCILKGTSPGGRSQLREFEQSEGP